VSKRVIIAGAATGIGEATAKALRERGAQVVGLDLNAGDGFIVCVTSQESVDRAAAAGIEQLGGLDALVNCAGIGLPQSAAQRPGENALRVVNVRRSSHA
jgi:NAD(P)-dependent dehydrogenase (short-subunit alcohol dehydrogenase family)